jgi:thiamine pyrophosphokinase
VLYEAEPAQCLEPVAFEHENRVNEVLKERNVAVREIALEGGRLDEVFRSITQAAPAKEVRP